MISLISFIVMNRSILQWWKVVILWALDIEEVNSLMLKYRHETDE